MAHPGNQLRSPQEIMNANQDTGVTPFVAVTGIMTKTSGASWVYAGSDAGTFRVSSIGGAGATPLSADSSSVSAKQGDASLLRVSALGTITTTNTSNALADGVTNAPQTFSDAIGTTIVAPTLPFLMNSAAKWDRARSISPSGVGLGVQQVGQWDASINQVSAKSLDAGLLLISAKQGDAGLFRVSSIGGTSSPLSADSSSISAKQGDASNLRVSALTLSLDATNNVERVEQQFNYYYMSAAGIQTIKATPGLLHSIVVNNRGNASTLKLYDNTSAASGLIFANVDTTLTTNSFEYDAKFTTGLTISTAGVAQADLTIIYR